MTILEVKDVSVIYSDDKRVAVEHASFKIEAGEYACIIGSNGSGKSTLVKGIVGLVPITSGQVIHQLSPEQYAYLSQITEIERDFPATVREVVLTGMQRSARRFPFYTREDKKKAAEAMEMLSISDLADYRIGNLSGGQKQRVLLARALCREPKLLILDEPCAGLDPAITAEFYSLIDHINKEQGVTILMVSHDMANIVHQGGKILQMRQKPLFWGTMKEYVKSEIAHSFLGREELATLGHRCGVPMQKDGIRKMQKPEMGSETDSETKQHLKDRNAEKEV